MKCPKCKSDKIKTVKVIGLCPCNIWTDRICECGNRWEKGSLEDKRANALTTGGLKGVL